MFDFLYKKRDDEILGFIEKESIIESEIDNINRLNGVEGMSDNARAMRDMYYRNKALKIHNKEKRERAIRCLNRFI